MGRGCKAERQINHNVFLHIAVKTPENPAHPGVFALVVRFLRVSMPKYPGRIVLMRHGESVANLQPQMQRTVPDHRVELTERGIGIAAVFFPPPKLNECLN